MFADEPLVRRREVGTFRLLAGLHLLPIVALALARLRCTLPVALREGDFELVQLVPLFILVPIAVRDVQELSQARTSGVVGGLFIGSDIISSPYRVPNQSSRPGAR